MSHKATQHIAGENIIMYHKNFKRVKKLNKQIYMEDFIEFGKKTTSYFKTERFGGKPFFLGCAPAAYYNIFPINNAYTEPK